jgi:uncharacterized membrane protein
MTTVKITITSAKDAEKVMQALHNLAGEKLITIQDLTADSVIPSSDQLDEIIDESELGSFYSPQEVRDILHM